MCILLLTVSFGCYLLSLFEASNKPGADPLRVQGPGGGGN